MLLKKGINFFCVQKKTPKFVVLHLEKKVQFLEKKFLGKNSAQFISAEKIFKMVCRIFFLKKKSRSRDISTFGDFTVPKFAFHNKIINKTRTSKNQENSTHRPKGKYINKSSPKISAR